MRGAVCLLLCLVGTVAAQDECLDAAKSDVCAAAGQDCTDPTPTAAPANDWKCVCRTPASGEAVAKAASCVIDECTAMCPTCAGTACSNAGQNCWDSNTASTSLNNWACLCKAPAVGSPAFLIPAACSLNECSTSANARICRDAGQTCNDPNIDPSSTGDWKCICPSPSTDSAVAAAASCNVDECSEGFITCAAAGQLCLDANTSSSSLRDWSCFCQAGSGSQLLGVAACTYTDECQDNWDKCTGAGQVCRDPDPMTMGDWECQCTPPFAGAAVPGAPTTCTLNECAQFCSTCAKTLTGDICSDAGQQCIDVDKSSENLRNWECVCVSPQTGTSNVGSVSNCILNECTANAVTCTSAKQKCEDPNTSPSSTGDWKCICDAGVGEAVAMAATCEEDECHDHIVTCLGAGQSCNDPNKDVSSKGDWTCDCVTPATGSQVAGTANCTFPMNDECQTQSIVCTAQSQHCVDPDPNIAGDWRCECVTPSIGPPVVGGPTVCELDECSTVCPECANTGMGNVCTGHHQTCVDPDTSATSLADWSCACTVASQGTQTLLGPTTCVVDECAGNTHCDAGQTCLDLDTSAESIGNWQCTCDVGEGSAVGTTPTCTVDECIANAASCTVAKQECNDPDLTVAGDWVCVCPPPATETMVGGQASCSVEGECLNLVCLMAGQSCTDPNTTMTDDWFCTCIAPQTGYPAIGTPAACVLDECTHQCSTCADSAHSAGHSYGNTCAKVGQLCNDPNKDTGSTSDWTCSCIAPAVGTPGIAGPATCVLDECLDPINNASCLANQKCIDTNTGVNSLGNWKCECQDPWAGSQMSGAANCILKPTPVPDTAAPDTSAPNTTVPDTLAPDTPAPNTTAPDTLAPDTPAPNTTAPDTSSPSTPQPDTLTPTMSPSTVAPDTLTPGSTAAPTTAPDTLAPGTTAAPTTAAPTVAPDTLAPGSTATPTTVPDTLAPGTTATPTTAPDTLAPTAVPTAVPPTLAPGSTAVPTMAPDTLAPGTTAVPTMAPPTLAPGDTAAPPTAAPTTTAPLTMTPGSTAVPTMVPPTLAPGTTAAPTVAPDTLAPGTTAVPTMVPPTLAPGSTATPTMAPDTASPDTTAPTTLVPGSTAMPTGVPTTAPVTTSPDTLAPGTTAVPTTVPSTLAPGTTAVPTTAPSTVAPGMTAVPTTAPSTLAPGTTAVPTAVPSTLAPGTTAVPTTAPSTLAPGTTAVPTAVPSTLAPGTTAVPTAAPATLVPGTTAEPTSVPSTLAPGTTAVPTTAPATLVPGTTAVPTAVPPTLVPGTTAVPTNAPPTLVPGTTAIPTIAPTLAPDTMAPPTIAPTLVPGTTWSPTTPAPPVDCSRARAEVDCGNMPSCKWENNACGAAVKEEPKSSDSGNDALWIVLIALFAVCCIMMAFLAYYKHKKADDTQKESMQELDHNRQLLEAQNSATEDAKAKEMEERGLHEKAVAMKNEELDKMRRELEEEKNAKADREAELALKEAEMVTKEEEHKNQLLQREEDEKLRQTELLKTVGGGHLSMNSTHQPLPEEASPEVGTAMMVSLKAPSGRRGPSLSTPVPVPPSADVTPTQPSYSSQRTSRFTDDPISMAPAGSPLTSVRT